MQAATQAAGLPVAVAPDAIAAAAPRRGRGLLGLLPVLIVFVLFIAAWYLVSYQLLSPDSRFLVPPPQDVIRDGFINSANRSELFAGLGRTTVVAAVGLAVAVVIGLTTAILMSQAKWLERSLFPYAVVLQCIPILALVPLIGFWFSFGFEARVIVCVMIALFPVIANTLFGIQSVERGQHDLFTLHGASRWTRLMKLQLPAALPAMFAGLRISAGLAVVGAVVGDFFFVQGDPGIGILIENYQSRLQSTQLFAAIILASGLGVVVFWIFGFIAARVVGSWHDTSGGGESR